MGEMADFVLDQMMDMDELQCRYETFDGANIAGVAEVLYDYDGVRFPDVFSNLRSNHVMPPPPRTAAAKRKALNYTSAKERAEKHQSGGTRTAYTVPAGMSIFQPKKTGGTYRLDFMPYIVGAGNPYADPGMIHYERTFFIHAGIGPNQGSYVCAARSANKTCFPCDWKRRQQDKPDLSEETRADLKKQYPKERQLFIVKDLNEPAKGYQLFEISNFAFGELLDTYMKKPGCKHHNFYHLQGGSTLEVTFEEQTGGGFTFCKAKIIEFEKRADYADSVLDEMPCLDDLLILLPYDKLKAIFLGGEDETGADDDAAPEDDGDGEDLPEFEDEKPIEEAPPPPRRKGTRPAPAPEPEPEMEFEEEGEMEFEDDGADMPEFEDDEAASFDGEDGLILQDDFEPEFEEEEPEPEPAPRKAAPAKKVAAPKPAQRAAAQPAKHPAAPQAPAKRPAAQVPKKQQRR